MKELFHLLVAHDLNGLFKKETRNGFLQFFRYIFVGGIATVVDWGILFVLDLLHPELIYLSVAVSFLAGLIVNYVLSKKFVFHAHTSGYHKFTELGVYVLTGLIGLGLTELIMYISVDLISMRHMFAKIIATALVLAWNFGSKKILLYRKHILK